ncbi:MAG TPA: sigma-54 dependent transcriptional regulator [Acidobacteriota bacterium]|nr:sigma-54 dependent transcriptional regulator [Acidobacteriota bacterium]
MSEQEGKSMGEDESRPSVLLADDDAVIRRLVQRRLEAAGLRVIAASDGNEALAKVCDSIQVALLDLQMPGPGGMECLQHISEAHPSVESIIITASSDIGDAVDAMKAGAFDYLTKPLNLDEVIELVYRAASTFKLKQENRQLRAAMGMPSSDVPFIGSSQAAREVIEAVEKISALDSSVLITGESGVGKGLVARLLHNAGPRRDQPFITVSCTALPHDLVEAELFGHEKGAFTGALEKRPGRVEMADGGTLFLDEIGDMPLDLQPKLLNFLQERRFQRIGGGREIAVDVRVIAATHQDLRAMCSEKRFREDLFFRLNVLPIHIPPLRRRMEDIPELTRFLLARLARRRKAEAYAIDSEAIEALMNYEWPGNVRELENVLERATAFSAETRLGLADLPPEMAGCPQSAASSGNLGGLPLVEVEKMAIAQTLAKCDGNKSEAARQLGISEKTIYNKMKRLGMFSSAS